MVLRRSTIVYCDSYENDNLFCNKCAFVRLRAALFVRLPSTNDRIATQRYSSPEIPIGSRVMSRTTSEPSDGRSRKMVANVAGCRSFWTFRDCHTSIAFTPVGPQPNLAHIFGWIWD